MGHRSTRHRPGRSLVVIGLLWVPWAAIVLRSWWTGEGTAIEDAYLAARDVLQPGGYAISGSLRWDPSWLMTHLFVIGLPWVAFLTGRRLAGRGRATRSGPTAEPAPK